MNKIEINKIDLIDLRGDLEETVTSLNAFGELLFYAKKADAMMGDAEYIIFLIAKRLEGIIEDRLKSRLN